MYHRVAAPVQARLAGALPVFGHPGRPSRGAVLGTTASDGYMMYMRVVVLLEGYTVVCDALARDPVVANSPTWGTIPKIF